MSIVLSGFLFFNMHMVGMEQVHGNNVAIVTSKDDGKTIKKCDALITSNPGLTLSVRVADCLPIFVTDDEGRVAGVIHAGWRGLYKGVIGKTLLGMQKEFRIKNEELIIYIGAHVCKKHYEIKADVSAKFGGVKFLDLAGVAKAQFIKLGVKSKNITIDSTCTFENKNLFSFRRDKTGKRNHYLLTLSS